MFLRFCQGVCAFFIISDHYFIKTSNGRSVSFVLFKVQLLLSLVGALVAISSMPSNAAIQWKETFPRPRGIILIDEINEEPLPFYIDHKDQKIKIGGRFSNFRFADDLTSAFIYAREVFNVGALNREILYRCITSTTKEELKLISKIREGSQLIFEGTLVDLSDGVFTIADCDVRTDVNMFHARDTSIIEGSWCYAYRGKTYDVTTYKKLDNGLYEQTRIFDSGSKLQKHIKVTRNGKKFTLTSMYDNGRTHRAFRNLINAFTISEEYAPLSRPQNTAKRCTVLSQ